MGPGFFCILRRCDPPPGGTNLRGGQSSLYERIIYVKHRGTVQVIPSERARNFDGEFGDPETHGPMVWRGIGGPSRGRRTDPDIGRLPAPADPPMGGTGTDSAGRNGFPGRPETMPYPPDPGTFGARG